jgi:hypothetical protein
MMPFMEAEYRVPVADPLIVGAVDALRMAPVFEAVAKAPEYVGVPTVRLLLSAIVPPLTLSAEPALAKIVLPAFMMMAAPTDAVRTPPDIVPVEEN